MVITLMLGALPAGAATVAVRDDAAFFSDRAKFEAARAISEIGARYRKDVVIETFREAPAELKRDLNPADKVATNQMFEQWAIRQARSRRVNGVYILLSREPAHLQVVVGNDTQGRAFTLRDRDDLVSLMLGKLRQKKNDEALLDAVRFIGATMSNHAVAGQRPNAAPAKSAPEPASPWGWVLAAILGALAAWLVVRVIRAMASGSAVGGASPGGGGGFMSSLLGGMFGAAAGMWLYDQFSGHHGSSDANTLDDSRRGDSGYSGQDSDYSGSGGDFGDSGGGGGDSGGGGDF